MPVSTGYCAAGDAKSCFKLLKSIRTPEAASPTKQCLFVVEYPHGLWLHNVIDDQIFIVPIFIRDENVKQKHAGTKVRKILPALFRLNRRQLVLIEIEIQGRKEISPVIRNRHREGRNWESQIVAERPRDHALPPQDGGGLAGDREEFSNRKNQAFAVSVATIYPRTIPMTAPS